VGGSCPERGTELHCLSAEQGGLENTSRDGLKRVVFNSSFQISFELIFWYTDFARDMVCSVSMFRAHSYTFGSAALACYACSIYEMMELGGPLKMWHHARTSVKRGLVTDDRSEMLQKENTAEAPFSLTLQEYSFMVITFSTYAEISF